MRKRRKCETTNAHEQWRYRRNARRRFQNTDQRCVPTWKIADYNGLIWRRADCKVRRWKTACISVMEKVIPAARRTRMINIGGSRHFPRLISIFVLSSWHLRSIHGAVYRVHVRSSVPRVTRVKSPVRSKMFQKCCAGCSVQFMDTVRASVFVVF